MTEDDIRDLRKGKRKPKNFAEMVAMYTGKPVQEYELTEEEIAQMSKTLSEKMAALSPEEREKLRHPPSPDDIPL